MAGEPAVAVTDEESDYIRQLYADMAGAGLQALWTQAETLMSAAPLPRALPWLWRWQEVRALAERAGQLIPVSRGGERRALAFANPGLGGAPFATPTLWGAAQYLGPHESAPAHRHSPGAIRFVIEGEGVWTTVEGDACHMRRGDLVLTPSWTWHEHHNSGERPMIWFDGLDLPLVAGLDAMFYQNYPQLYQGAGSGLPLRSAGERVFGRPGLRAGGQPAGRGYSPLLVYRWEDTSGLLADLLAAGDDPAVTVTFTDPTSGADALPTMRCQVHRLRPGQRTPTCQVTGSAIYLVHAGSGQSVIGGQRFAWSAGDVFVVPSWAPLDHQADQEADLFSVSDLPVLEKLGLARSQTLAQQQAVTGEWHEGRRTY